MSALRELLDERAESLISLSHDSTSLDVQEAQFKLRPVHELPIVVAVDWSEVQHYIQVQDAYKRTSAGSGRKDVELINGAHQAALSSLFWHFPSRLLLLPPYHSELVGFVSYARFIEQALNPDIRTAQEILERASREDPRLRRLLAQAAQGVDRSTSSSAAYIEAWKALAKKGTPDVSGDLKSWLSTQFAPFYLHLRTLSVEALGSLRELLAPKGNQASRLMALVDLESGANDGLRAPLIVTTEAIVFWEEELRLFNPEKQDRMRQNDAVALAYLQLLNPLLHDRGQKLLFVTRSADIRAVMKAYPGTFGDLFVEGGAGASLPTMARTWVYFMELQDLRSSDESLSTRLGRRLEAIGNESKSIGLEHNLRQIQKELSNVQSMETGRKQDLHARVQNSTEELLVALMQVAADPDEFVRAKQEIRAGIREKIDKLAEFIDVPETFVLYFGEDARYKSIFLSVLEKLGPEPFCEMESEVNATALRDMLTYIVGEAGPEVLNKWKQSGSWNRNLDSQPGSDQLRLEATWHYCMGLHSSPSVARALENASQLPLFAFAHLKLMQTDVYLRNRRINPADSALRSIGAAIGRERQQVQPSAVELNVAVASARVLLYIDEAEGYGESLARLPAGGDGRPVLASVRDVMWEQYLRHESVVSSNLRLFPAILNNYIYSACRLVGVISCDEDLLGPLYRDILDRLTSLEDAEETLNASICDSLCYYYTKAALRVSQPDSLLLEAEKWLERAQAKANSEKPVQRLMRSIDRHQLLLNDVRHGVHAVTTSRAVRPPTSAETAAWVEYYKRVLLTQRGPVRLIEERDWEVLTCHVHDVLRECPLGQRPIQLEASMLHRINGAVTEPVQKIRSVLYQLWQSKCLRYEQQLLLLNERLQTAAHLRRENTRYILLLIARQVSNASRLNVEALSKLLYGPNPSPNYTAEVRQMVAAMETA